jgi:membrane associated rhomboid family serine protease
MTDSSRNPDDYCYRHPDRLSFVLCERCGRTICLECQTHVNGMVLCPDDAQRSNVTMINVNARPPKPKRRLSDSRLLSRIAPETPIVTYVIGGLVILLWLVDLAVGGAVIQTQLAYVFGGQTTKPWTVITAMFSELGGGDAFINVLFFGFSMFVLGRLLERQLGHLKFLLLYLVSGFGAAIFALLFNGVVESANIATFGLIGAAIVLFRHDRRNLIWIGVVLLINVIQTLLSTVRAIAWQGWIGALLVGLVITWALMSDDSSPRGLARQRTILIGVPVLLAALAIVKTAFLL